MKTIKIIIENIPKTIRVIIGTVFIAPILGYVVLQLALNKSIDLSIWNMIYILVFIFILSLIGYIIGSYRTVNQLINIPIKSKDVLEKKMLPYRDISIGQYSTKHLSVDIRAKIFLIEKVKPSIDIFLERVYEGEPYCSICLRPLDKWNASYMADYAQLGYKCPTCETEIKGDWVDLQKCIKATVRTEYDNYWDNYNKQIYELTGGKPKEFDLPKY